MSERSWMIAKKGSTVVLLLAAGWFGISRFHRSMASGEQNLGVWFYDQSEQVLYVAPRDAIPPHKGIAGEAGDGVRAMVVICRADKDKPGQRRIAYLETHTPELKRILEDVRTARAAGRVYQGEIPSPDGEFSQKNTLVRRPDETAWHDLASPEAQTITTEWKSWSCSDGSPVIVSTP
jgi:hypothetical protein